MIIQCKSCARRFVVKDRDIPDVGRVVQCGYCSVTWHQMPVLIPTKTIIEKKIKKPIEEANHNLSVEKIKASDGKTYRFLGSQWAVLLPSGKTGLFAKREIGNELDKLTGRKKKSVTGKKKKKRKKEVDPSSESLSDEKQLPQIYESKQGLGFLGYVFLIIIIGFSVAGALKTFENDILNYFPETKYIYNLLDEQLQFLAESVKNMIVIVNDLISSY